MNFQSGQWVYGLEGDVSLAGLSSDFDVGPDSFEVDSNVLFTVRGRAGVAFDRWLVFATAGLAGASVKLNDVGFGSDSGHMLGFTIGGGAEVWLHDRVSLRGDILYFDLGSHTFEAGSFDDIVSLSGVMARAAVNVAFLTPRPSARPSGGRRVRRSRPRSRDLTSPAARIAPHGFRLGAAL